MSEIGDKEMEGDCELCGQACTSNCSEINVLECSNERCGKSMYHQYCLENQLKIKKVNKNRKTGFRCPKWQCQGQGQGPGHSPPLPQPQLCLQCPGRIIKQTPVTAKSSLKSSNSSDDIVVVQMQQSGRQGRDEVEGNGEVVVVVQQKSKGGQLSSQAAGQQQLSKDKDRVITMKANQRNRGLVVKNDVRKQSPSQSPVVKNGKIESIGQVQNGGQVLNGQLATRATELVSRRGSESSQSKKHDHIILVENAWTSRSHLSSSLADRKPQQLPPLTSDEAFPPPAVTRSSTEYPKLQPPRSSFSHSPKSYSPTWPPSHSSTPLPSVNQLRSKNQGQVVKQILRRPQMNQMSQIGDMQRVMKPVDTPFANSPQSPTFDEPFAAFMVRANKNERTQAGSMNGPVNQLNEKSKQQSSNLISHHSHSANSMFSQSQQQFNSSQQKCASQNSPQLPNLPSLIVPQNGMQCQNSSSTFQECVNQIKIRRLQSALKALMNIGYDLQTARSAVQNFGEDLQSSLAWLQAGRQPIENLQEAQICIDWEISRMHELVQQGASVNQVVEAVKSTNGDVIQASEILFPQYYLSGQGQLSPLLSPISYPSPSPSVEQTSQNTHDQIQELNLDPEEKTLFFRGLGSFCLSDTSFKSPLDVNASITSDDSFSESTNFVVRGSRFMNFFRSKRSCENSQLFDHHAFLQLQEQLSENNNNNSNNNSVGNNFGSKEHINYILDSLDDSSAEFDSNNHRSQDSQTTASATYDYGLPESLYEI